jgi:phosphoglycerate dehydrogenase-like enzyme
MKLLIYPAVEEERLQKIRQAAGDLVVVNVSDADRAIDEIRDADGFYGKLTPPMLAAAQRLRWVQTPTASLEHYLFPELISHPCTLTNMRGLFSDVIADHVLGYILCFARNLHLYIRQQAHSVWQAVGGEEDRPTVAAGVGRVSASDRAHLHVSDCTLGIIGLGSIGAEIARRAAAFGMRRLAVDPVHRESADVKEVWPVARLPELLGASDFVVIAAPHTPETAGMFGRQQFAEMKSTAYLINIGRGAIVKLDDLCVALRSGTIAGAALDVFEQEPLPAEHPLWQMDSVIITPHVAACSPRIAERHLAVLLDNVARFARGQPLRNVADKQRWF